MWWGGEREVDEETGNMNGIDGWKNKNEMTLRIGEKLKI